MIITGLYVSIFQMAAQTCTEAPMIINITDFTRPHVSDFFTILS